MTRIHLYLPLLLALLLTIGAGIASGRINNRWGQSADLVEAGRQLEELPEQFGPWVMQASQPIEPQVREMLQCAGGLHNVYRNGETGDVVSMVMFVGPPGPMSVHSPEVCYTSAGHQLLEPPSRFKLRESDPAEKQFWRTKFKAVGLDGGVLCAVHAWNAGGGWQAPLRPRLAFGGASKLYKLQVAAHLGTQAEMTSRDPCRAFLQDFLPLADKRVLP